MVRNRCLCCSWPCAHVFPYLLFLYMVTIIRTRYHRPFIDTHHLRRLNHRLSLFLLRCSRHKDWYDEYLVKDAFAHHLKTFHRSTDVLNYIFQDYVPPPYQN